MIKVAVLFIQMIRFLTSYSLKEFDKSFIIMKNTSEDYLTNFETKDKNFGPPRDITKYHQKQPVISRISLATMAQATTGIEPDYIFYGYSGYFNLLVVDLNSNENLRITTSRGFNCEPPKLLSKSTSVKIRTFCGPFNKNTEEPSLKVNGYNTVYKIILVEPPVLINPGESFALYASNKSKIMLQGNHLKNTYAPKIAANRGNYTSPQSSCDFRNEMLVCNGPRLENYIETSQTTQFFNLVLFSHHNQVPIEMEDIVLTIAYHWDISLSNLFMLNPSNMTIILDGTTKCKPAVDFILDNVIISCKNVTGDGSIYWCLIDTDLWDGIKITYVRLTFCHGLSIKKLFPRPRDLGTLMVMLWLSITFLFSCGVFVVYAKKFLRRRISGLDISSDDSFSSFYPYEISESPSKDLHLRARSKSLHNKSFQEKVKVIGPRK